ncbi:MAG TPA: NAD(P)-binding domain-containing protein, partial [Prolixibacteraceae bacterium]|nr:NAD(P)-binding domain-containing protein [Prolixibacteraceae bacterium]
MRIVLLGSGNLATRLGIALHEKHIEIIQVYARSESGGSQLSGLLGCSHTTSRAEIRTDADLYILAVSEDAIPGVLSGSGIKKQLVVHTAGSLSMDILSAVSENYG